MNKTIIDALNYRYATKKFDPTKKLDNEQIDALIETARLTATSYGMQLMKLVVVENQDIKDKLVEASYGQKQVSDASQVLVLCREKNFDESLIQGYINNIAQIRAVELDKLEGFKNAMSGNLLNKPKSELEVWMNNQVYITLGKLMMTCALLKIDSCPMEGFQPDKYDKILNLSEKNLTAVLVLPVGYRSEEDKNSKAKKVRRLQEDFLIKLS